jgi:molecular chaperone HtpG
MFGMGNMPEMYNLVVNSNSELATTILNTTSRPGTFSKTSFRFSQISQGLLKGRFNSLVKRSFELIK